MHGQNHIKAANMFEFLILNKTGVKIYTQNLLIAGVSLMINYAQ